MVAKAHHEAELTAILGASATLTVTEQVILGRTGEEPGR